jgi:general stress protein YciG
MTGSNRGFAAMDEQKQKDIASKGGQSVPPEKRSFSQDPELAAEAGRKGGQSSDSSAGGKASGGNFSKDRQKASEAGKKGGQASHGGGRS